MREFTVKTALKTWQVTAFDKSDAIAWVEAQPNKGGMVMWARESR